MKLRDLSECSSLTVLTTEGVRRAIFDRLDGGYGRCHFTDGQPSGVFYLGHATPVVQASDGLYEIVDDRPN
jgi:hypothetical protein